MMEDVAGNKRKVVIVTYLLIIFKCKSKGH